MQRTVVIVAEGRSGDVHYRDADGALSFYWEFGVGDVVVSVRTGTAEEWRRHHPWALERRSEILAFVASELIRQRGSGCTAEIDDAGGWINLHRIAVEPPSGSRQPQSTAPPSPTPPRSEPAESQQTPWPMRYSKLRMALGVGTGVAALCVGGGVWLASKALSIDPGKGTPLGDCARSGSHIAVLIQTLEPYVPSLHRDHSKDRHRLSIFLVPLDGSAPRLVPVVGDLEPNQYSLAKILGSDGRTMWFDAVGIRGVDETRYTLVDDSALRAANPALPPEWWLDTRGMEVDGALRITARDRSAALQIDPSTLRATSAPPRPGSRSPLRPALDDSLGAGLQTSPTSWLGLHSKAEAEGQFRPSRWVRRIEHADQAKVARQLWRGELEPSSEGRGKILAMNPVGPQEFLNAAFLRQDRTSEPLRLGDPPGALMLWTSGPGLAATAMVGRVDDAGTLLWQLDTGIDRFTLSQILPGRDSTAFVGTRPPVPDTVSEPILVIVQHDTGAARTISLWQ